MHSTTQAQRKFWAVTHEGARAFSYSELDEDKRRQLAQRLLAMVRSGNIDRFIEVLFHTFTAMRKKIPPIIATIHNERNPHIQQDLAMAFLLGMASPEAYIDPAGAEDSEEDSPNASTSQHA